jgi:hypothetical protein
MLQRKNTTTKAAQNHLTTELDMGHPLDIIGRIAAKSLILLARVRRAGAGTPNSMRSPGHACGGTCGDASREFG